MNRMIGTESYASNQLTVANQYRYRADGLRTMKILGDEESTVPYEELSSYYDFNYWRNNRTWTYGYDGQMSVLELYKGETHEGNIVQDATRNTLGARGIDMIVAERTWGPSGDPLLYQKRKQYPLYDGHGNMFASVIRGSGTSYQLVNEKRYDAWGVTGTTSGPGAALANPKEGYCGSIGHKLDPESGLIYMRARYYEPGTGRFISEDPAMDGANWYAYCGGDSLNYTDFTGLVTLADLLISSKDEIESKLIEIAVARQMQTSIVSTLMTSLMRFAQRYSDALGDDFENILSQANGRVMIFGIDRGGGYQVAVDLVDKVVKVYGPGGQRHGLPPGVPHWFP